MKIQYYVDDKNLYLLIRAYLSKLQIHQMSKDRYFVDVFPHTPQNIPHSKKDKLNEREDYPICLYLVHRSKNI